MTSEPAAYSERVDAALALVAGAFRHETRKGTTIPYLTHLLAVAALVGEHGGDEDQLVAALLHDYLEDIDGASAEAVEEAFGARVARLVVDLSDTVTQPKPPWEGRKIAYLLRLEGKPPELKLISAADKLHNATSILRDHLQEGDAVFDRFTPTREQTLWYYRSVITALGHGWSHPLLDELTAVVRTLHERTGVPWALAPDEHRQPPPR